MFNDKELPTFQQFPYDVRDLTIANYTRKLNIIILLDNGCIFLSRQNHIKFSFVGLKPFAVGRSTVDGYVPVVHRCSFMCTIKTILQLKEKHCINASNF